MTQTHFDWIVIGSGFGGSVSALRLVERGYDVLLIEKGKRFTEDDFPKSNWDLKRWFWMPELGMKGIFKMSFFKHVTVLHGVGVGGGSLVYANTLPKPKRDFFQAASWAHLSDDWQAELDPHYETAKRMLGATPNPTKTKGDKILEEIAAEIGKSGGVEPTDVAVFFGTPGERVPDPFFDGEGPDRVGCTHCGACMTGCRVGAKNTLDKNYLYLAEKRGLTLRAETEVTALRANNAGGYVVETLATDGSGREIAFTADKVVMSGGVMGTVPLLLKMQQDPKGLPNMSKQLGEAVRTNSEALIGVISTEPNQDFTKGVAITSILHTDEHSHVEPVRYGQGSDFFRLMALPHAPGPTVFSRIVGTIRGFMREPVRWAKALTVRDFSKQSQVLLYMRTLEGTLSMRLGRNVWTGFKRGLVTNLDDPNQAPSAFMKEATDLAERWARKVKGVTMGLLTETLLGVPSTAHILGGCCMGADASEGVIDSSHQVFGYDGLYIIDGSAVSANPGVNPSLTITAMAERAMSLIPAKTSSPAN